MMIYSTPWQEEKAYGPPQKTWIKKLLFYKLYQPFFVIQMLEFLLLWRSGVKVGSPQNILSIDPNFQKGLHTSKHFSINFSLKIRSCI